MFDNFEDIFKKHKFIIFLFFLIFLLFLICYFKSTMCLFFDMPAMFLGLFNGYDEQVNNYIIFTEDRIRIFTSVLSSIPFNLYLHNIKNASLLNYLQVFTTSYFIIQFFALILNYIIAIRTKRYDIAVIAFAFYAIFSTPNAIWAVREIHIAYLFYFMLLSYFLTEIKLKLWDLIPIILIILYLFESFEITLIFGLIMYISMLIYKKSYRGGG